MPTGLRSEGPASADLSQPRRRPPGSPLPDKICAAPPMPRRNASSNVTPRICQRCVRPRQSICHCVAQPSSRSSQTRSPDQNDFATLLGRNRRQRRERRRPEFRAGDVRFRQRRRARQHDAHPSPVGCSEQRVTLQVGLASIRCHDVVLRPLVPSRQRRQGADDVKARA